MDVEQIQGDIRDRLEVQKACKGMDLVFHVAAKPGVWGTYEDYYRTNVIGTRNVIEGCNLHHVPRLVYTSSPSVVFDGADMEGVDESVPYPKNYHAHYPKTKAMAEQDVVKAASRDLRTIVLRPHLIWGPGDTHLAPRIIERAKGLKRVGDGTNLVDTVYIDNAAHAHILAADRLDMNPEVSGKVYFISQGKPVPLWDMVNDILKAGGLSPVKRSISRKTARIIGAVLEFVYSALKLNGEPRMTRFLADELATSHWFDISAARKDLGYTPLVSTEEGLRRLEAWLRNESGIISGGTRRNSSARLPGVCPPG
jgi:nucleoside-diphosphate-sugar epimerase